MEHSGNCCVLLSDAPVVYYFRKRRMNNLKKILMIMLLCTVLSLSACAAGGRDRNASGNLPQPRETLQITPEDEESTHISERALPDEITDGASAVYCSWTNDTCGFLLRCGYPAAGQMTKGLYRTTDGQNWTSVRELTAVIPNYPKGIFFWSQSQGIILTNYHGAENCVFVTQDGGDTWNAVPFDLHGEIPDYNYLEAEQAWLEKGVIMVELSAHFEDREPIQITRPLTITK